MIQKVFESEEEWKNDRLGLITGTKSHGCIPKKNGTYGKTFWEVLAERVCQQPEGEDPMNRGKRLEDEAIRRLEKETNLEFDNRKILWISEKLLGLAVSPDGVGLTDTSVACEIKCLNSGHHLEAYFSKDYPKSSTLYYSYKAQARQYFQVNDELQKLYVGFYDPFSPVDFHYFVIHRSEIAKVLEEERLSMQAALAQLELLESKLVKF